MSVWKLLAVVGPPRSEQNTLGSAPAHVGGGEEPVAHRRPDVQAAGRKVDLMPLQVAYF
jgi:hypothetical protein